MGEGEVDKEVDKDGEAIYILVSSDGKRRVNRKGHKPEEDNGSEEQTGKQRQR